VIAAFAYLILNTARNRLQSQLRRLRTPRYAIGLVLGLGYFWLILGRHTTTQPNAKFGSTLSASIETLAPVILLVMMAGIWIFGGDRSALAFSEAEVSMLLPAPVSRRALISYKLVQSQIAIMVSVIIWVFLLRRGSAGQSGLRSLLAVWAIFTTLNLHRMGAALTRASQVEYRATGQKRNRAGKVFGLIVALLIFGTLFIVPMSEMQAPDSSSPFGFVHDIMRLLESPGVRTALYPFRLVTAPAFARSADAWTRAMLPALAIVLLHVWWVLRSDTAFEEAAAMASAERARFLEAMRSRRTIGVEPEAKAGAGTIALASTGTPAVAIVWKNAIALRRTLRAGVLLRLLFMMLMMSVAFVMPAIFANKAGDPARLVGVVATVMSLMAPLMMVATIRNDLRSDMLHLPFLKSLPLAGADLVLAEVASGAILMVAVQFVLLATAGVAFAMSSGTIPIPAAVRAGVLLASPVTLLALDGAICTILNGTAVLFPAWIRLGPAGPGGIELMGQTMLSMIASFLAFTVLLLVPVALGAAAWFALSASMAVAVTVACVLGAIALAAECYGMILALGRAFERAEPQQIA
jgi:ABC-2 type transport system permease protein